MFSHHMESEKTLLSASNKHGGVFVLSVAHGTGNEGYLLAAAAAEAVGFAEQPAWADEETADRPNHTQQDMWLWTGS